MPRNKQITFDYSLFLGKQRIEMVETVQTLGIIFFNENMSGKEQVRVVRGKHSRTVDVINKFRHIFPQNVKLIIYSALF